MTASSARSPSPGARIAAVVVLLLMGLLVFAQGSSGPQPESPLGNVAPSVTIDPDTQEPGPAVPAPPADLAALLDGLSLGNEFDGWKVVNFTPTNDKLVWIEFGKEKTFFSVGIEVKGKGNPPPPIQTEHYEVGYGMVRPKGAPISQEVLTKMAEEVASRIRKREKEVAKPSVL